MDAPTFAVGHSVAPVVAARLAQHRTRSAATLVAAVTDAPLPDAAIVSRLVDAAFWASLRREEGYVPTISLAYLPPSTDVHPIAFAKSLSLDPAGLARLGPAVEQPGVHLGVWWQGEELAVWGTTRTIPPFSFVVEVVAPGLIVLKHRPHEGSRKFVNLAVIEGDTVKVVDEHAPLLPGCPALLTDLLGHDGSTAPATSAQMLVQLAVSMRRHRRGGTLLVVPDASTTWEQSIVSPIAYAISPGFGELAQLVKDGAQDAAAVREAVRAVAGLTAVDGATIVTEDYTLLAFGAKIRRRQGSPQVDELILTEPIVGNQPTRVTPGQLGGTRHLSGAQFVNDQKEGLALVASQDGRFTLFAWSPSDQLVHAHRVDALLA